MAHDHIRILVYVEKSSRLRFDSDTIRFADNETPDKLTVRKCVTFLYKKTINFTVFSTKRRYS